MNDLVSLLPIVAIAVIFWLLIIRPASRRQKEAAALQSAIAVGDDVMLSSGIFGTVVGSADDHIRLEIAPGVEIRVVRGAVASVRRDELSDDVRRGDDADAATETDPDRTEER